MPELLPVSHIVQWGNVKYVNYKDVSIYTEIFANNVTLGEGILLSPEIQIGMPDKPVENLILGNHVRLFGGKIASRNFVCGDYVTIHDGVWAYGRNDIVIGHNAWFGMRCTLDAEGGFRVGNGFGAGQDSHMWSHIRHGDYIQGCKYLSYGKFEAEDDVWLVGRCTSAPAHHREWSVALTESNLIRGMSSNRVYAGNPAVDITEKVGEPYVDLPYGEKKNRFDFKVFEFMAQGKHCTKCIEDIAKNFDVSTRTYKKTGKPEEVDLMRFLLPEAKFVPEDAPRVTWPPSQP